MMRAPLALAITLLASSAFAQAPSPAQMGITAGTPQTLEVLDSSKTWVPLGTVSNSAFTGYGAGTDVRSFGCKADGTTDQTSCINNALTNAPDCVIIPATANGFYSAGTITVTRCLRGTVFNASGTTSAYDLSGTSRILCNNQVAQPCLVANRPLAGTSGQSTQIENITLVGTNAGNVSATPVAGSKGFQWQQGNGLVLTNFHSSNFDTCAYFGPTTTSPGTGPLGLKAFNTFFSRCQKHYVVADGAPELYFIGGRWGGAGDYPSADDFLFATKTTNSGAGGGPNTIVLDSMQLNTAAVGCPFRWGGFTGTGGVFGANKVSNSTIEINDAGYTGSASMGMICVDNSLPRIPGMLFTSNVIQTDGGSALHPTFNIASALPWTDNFSFVNNRPLTGAPFTLTISGAVGNAFPPLFMGNYMQSSNTFVAGDTTAHLSLIGNYYGGATFSGQWNNLNLVGNFGGITDNATGSVYQSNGFAAGAGNTWTPTLFFSGGGSATYVSHGTWFRTQEAGLTAYFDFTISALSSPIGNITITGYPKTCAGHPSSALITNASNFTGLTGAPYAIWLNGSPNINLAQTTATGLTNVAGANLTATTSFSGTVTCGIAQ
jgi:hypothetical protein